MAVTLKQLCGSVKRRFLMPVRANESPRPNNGDPVTVTQRLIFVIIAMVIVVFNLVTVFGLIAGFYKDLH